MTVPQVSNRERRRGSSLRFYPVFVGALFVPALHFGRALFRHWLNTPANPYSPPLFETSLLIGAVLWTPFALVEGIIIGLLSQNVKNILYGTLIGTCVCFAGELPFLVLSQDFWMFLEHLPRDVLPGAFAGGLVAVAGRTMREPITAIAKRRGRAIDAVTFMGLCAVLILQVRSDVLPRRFLNAIISAGGTIAARNSNQGHQVIEIRLIGERFGDKEVEGLLPILKQFPIVDLDLGDSQITQVTIARLATMKNLSHLRLYGCPKVKMDVEQLREQLPHVQILSEPLPAPLDWTDVDASSSEDQQSPDSH